jgi:hypothetical protein
MDLMLDLLSMSPESVEQLARSPRELETTNKVANTRYVALAVARARNRTVKGRVKLEVLDASK